MVLLSIFFGQPWTINSVPFIVSSLIHRVGAKLDLTVGDKVELVWNSVFMVST